MKLDSHHTVTFTPFEATMKQTIVTDVIASARGTLLDGVRQNYSAEGGFELPLTPEWADAVEAQNPDMKDYLRYHNARQFRFTCSRTSTFVDGVYTKDCMRWWTSLEKQTFQLLIEAAIHKNNTCTRGATVLVNDGIYQAIFQSAT
jgi:hypothetical protein